MKFEAYIVLFGTSKWHFGSFYLFLFLYKASIAGRELMNFMQRNEIKPFRNFLVPLAQVR